jgi:hypothetical protein
MSYDASRHTAHQKYANPNRAVLADVERVGENIRLVGVRPLDGEMPEVGHLLGGLFPDVKALRLALVAALKGVVGDTLDNVLLSGRAYAAWQQKAAEAARALPKGVDPGEIPDEKAKPLPDGRLLIWVELPGGGRVELAVPKDEWAWRVKPS